jgi:hypothetical protein
VVGRARGVAVQLGVQGTAELVRRQDIQPFVAAVLRRVIAGASVWLAPGGHVLVETSEHQAPQLVETVARNGLIG